MSGFSATLEDAVPAVRAALVALAGVGAARMWFSGDWLLACAVTAVVVLVAVFLSWLGERQLPKRPVAAVLLMEWWILLPMAIAAVGAAAVIISAVELAVPEGVKDPVVKETGGAVATAISVLLTSTLVSGVGDKDKSGVGDRIKTTMRKYYVRADKKAEAHDRAMVVPKGETVEKALYSDFWNGLEGWDRQTRIERARELKASLG